MNYRHYWAAQVLSAIKTEIETGRTFAGVALGASDANKIARNTANARKAYDTARKWAKSFQLSPADSQEVAERLELLRAELAKLERPKPNPNTG